MPCAGAAWLFSDARDRSTHGPEPAACVSYVTCNIFRIAAPRPARARGRATGVGGRDIITERVMNAWNERVTTYNERLPNISGDDMHALA